MKYKKGQFYQLEFKSSNQVEHHESLKSIYEHYSPCEIGCNIDWLWKNKISFEKPFENSKVKISLIKPVPPKASTTKLIPQVGDKIWFSSEKKPYTVRACDSRFIICTKPFNLKKTVYYTIIDLQNNIRGTENLIFCMGFDTDECCNEALKRLQTNQSEVSYRNRIELDIIRIKTVSI